jgi:membrane protein YdbS with pleckstrin-like domain
MFWALVLLFVGVIASLVAIQWTIFFLYLAVVLGGLGLLFWQPLWQNDAALFIMVYSIIVSIVGFLIVEMYRRSHKYYITNLRIVFKGGLFTKRERTIRYEKIADINSRQGILGQIFGFGTIIPISESGFGLGSDKSMAGGGVEVGGTKARLFGFVGGGKEVQTPIARSYYELHGVYPFKDVQKLVEDMVQSHVPTQYQKEQVEFSKQQVDIQKQMRDLLHQQVKGKPQAKPVKQKPAVAEEPEEEEEPEKDEEEAFQPEQVDIQKQMQQLLKKQRVMKPAKEEIEDEEEDEEEETEEKKEEREVA